MCNCTSGNPKIPSQALHTDLEGAARDAWLGAMTLQACNEERRSERLLSWADRRAVRPFC